MKLSREIVFGTVLCIGSILMLGCGQGTRTVGTMRTQGGREVVVLQDYVDSPLNSDGLNVGDPYYLENGAKVNVNKGSGLTAPGRPTNWHDQ